MYGRGIICLARKLNIWPSAEALGFNRRHIGTCLCLPLLQRHIDEQCAEAEDESKNWNMGEQQKVNLLHDILNNYFLYFFETAIFFCLNTKIINLL
jgi:hypothetical protein